MQRECEGEASSLPQHSTHATMYTSHAQNNLFAFNFVLLAFSSYKAAPQQQRSNIRVKRYGTANEINARGVE